jgi:hypothetical protein
MATLSTSLRKVNAVGVAKDHPLVPDFGDRCEKSLKILSV